jgi:sugar (pentulose or hexulose) kinase
VVLRPTEPADWVSASVHGLVRLGGRPLVAAGTADLAARALGAVVGPGAAAALLDDDDPVVVAGASTPVADPSGRVVGLADAAGNHLPTVAIAPLGHALDGIASVLGTDPAGLATRAAAAAAERGGRPPSTVVLPARPGGPATRPPGRAGVAIGLDGDTTAPELAWAALLGAAAEILDALEALEAVGGGEPDDGALVLAGTVARRPGLAAAVADLAGREVVVARFGGVATGACVQAAAVLQEANPLDVARSWRLDGGDVVEPAGVVDAAACLAAHAAARGAVAAAP